MVRVRALIPFAGLVTMAIGEEREIPEEIARDLLSCGYVEAVEGEPKKRGKAKK